MDKVRGVLLGILVSSSLAACNPSSNSEAPPEAHEDGFIMWADISGEEVNVPQGVSYSQVPFGDGTAAEIGTVAEDARPTGQTGGVSVRLSDQFEAQASGSRVQVTVRALAPIAGSTLGVAYSTHDVGNSGWQQFALTQEPDDYTFVYDVPAMRGGSGDFLGFRSYGDSRVQILGFKTEVLPASPVATP